MVGFLSNLLSNLVNPRAEKSNQMDQDKLERYNAIEIERQKNSLELARSRVERNIAEMEPLVTKALADALVDPDINIRLKAAFAILDRTVPKVAVRSTGEDAEVVESEARKASRAEIEELIKKRKAS